MLPRILPRLPRILQRVRLTPILFLGLAALLEIFIHTRHFVVPPPDHELDEPFYTSCQEPAVDQPREDAALVMLVRNSEMFEAMRTIKSVEKKFNRWFHYPVVFLNDKPWDTEFITTLGGAVSGEARFEVVPQEEWTYPPNINQDAAKASMKAQGDKGIIYAGLETYHHMCRFYSGKFYNLEALKPYKWYWRIEPDVEFYCSITYDPFVEMSKHNKLYGFTIALWEEGKTCPGLFRQFTDWKESHRFKTTELWRAFMSPSWAPWPFRTLMSWLPHRDRFGDAWSLCHYWSNFEIANLDFFRSKEYQELFEYLDRAGGFYFERWGDAAVHSLAVAMLLEPERVHHFEDLGYRHDWFYQCPANAPGGQLTESKTLGDRVYAPALEGGIGCRCDCDGSKPRNYARYCLDKLKAPTTRKRQQTGFFSWGFGWLEWIRHGA